MHSRIPKFLLYCPQKKARKRSHIEHGQRYEPEVQQYASQSVVAVAALSLNERIVNHDGQRRNFDLQLQLEGSETLGSERRRRLWTKSFGFAYLEI